MDAVDGAVTTISISGLPAVNTSQVGMHLIPIHTAHLLGSQPRHTSAAGKAHLGSRQTLCRWVSS